MLKTDSMKEKLAWTTWEDLLLTCAVKRYGLQDWNAIAMELQRRVSVPVLVNAQICLKKYNDLKRRFTDNISDENVVTPAGGDEVDSSVPWLEELRKRRIDELRRKVDGHDLSIQNLETKAKRLEEEREQSYEIDYKKPDLEKDTGEDRSENDKNNATGNPPVDNDAGVSASGERSDRENQSVNESNSTDNRGAGEKISEPVQNRLVNPDPDSKPVRADSWNDSSKLGEDKKIDYESAELRDWAGDETKGGIKESSDMQSSASLTRTSGGGYEPVVSPDTMRLDQVNKSEPLVGFFDTIRSHKHGSMFEIRLDSQKSDKYKNLVKQHVDLETVHTRIENGSYSICTTKFYLDLLLLVNNAIIFFPKASPESAAAFDLRNLVLKDMKKKCIGRQSDPYPLNPKPDLNKPDALLAKQKSSTPLIVCRKRSSISSKPSSSNKAEEKPVIKPKPPVKSSSSSEEESSIKLKLMEKPVTGARSMRRSGNGRTNSTTTSTNKGEAPKTTEKKKTEVLNTAKKRGAADFLKRIKKNSPGKGTPLLETLKSSPENSSESSRRESRDRQKKRVDERKEVTTRQKGCVSGGAGRKPVQTYLKTAMGYFVDSPRKAFLACTENDQDDRRQEPKAVMRDDLQKTPMKKEMEEFWYADECLLDLNPCNCLVHEQSENFYSELDSHWIRVEKSEPWWRTTDKDDLASLVSSKKLEQFENCDLPQPQTKRYRSGPSECVQCFNQGMVPASLDEKAEKKINLDENALGSPTSVSMVETQCIMGSVQYLPSSSDMPFRNDGFATEVDEAEKLQKLDSDLTKAQLLEALRHSQTRAREAEKAAQQAYNEKEHIIKHFFGQASHLFAYRRWLQILQIETLCLQLKNNKDEPTFTYFPAMLPFPVKCRQLRKGRRKATKRKNKICRGVVAFALGLSLTGAGLLLGWTMGCLFPAL